MNRKSLRNKALAGTLRADRVKRTVAERMPRCPSAPAHLSSGAQDEWKKLAPVAHELGTLTRADLRAFALLCETLATETTAREDVASKGMTITAGSGGQKVNPSVKMMETARGQAARLLESFALTPKGRESITPAPPDPERNPFDDVENGKKR